jgi:hypothetical protein
MQFWIATACLIEGMDWMRDGSADARQQADAK